MFCGDSWHRFFFESPNSPEGLVLDFRGSASQLCFAELRILISDEAAIKASLCNKGASGLVFCVACQNTIDHKSACLKEVVAHRYRVWKQTSLDSDNTHRPMAYMEEQKTRMNKTSFDKLQTAMGFNYKPTGLLAHPAYGPPVIDCIMYDWFHIFL